MVIRSLAGIVALLAAFPTVAQVGPTQSPTSASDDQNDGQTLVPQQQQTPLMIFPRLGGHQ